MSTAPIVPLNDDAQAPLQLHRAGPADNRLLYADPAYFTAEMAALGEAAWFFVGTADELAGPNDWVRAEAFGQDVFVQNVAGTLRGFSNICQHRGFPIRREPRGNGPILCGFHAWRYDGEGRLIGVARNEELFGMTREERAGRSLPAIRVETAGTMVFVAVSPVAPSLADFLGRYHALLAAITSRAGPMRHRWTGEARANWKLYYEITLDDYHVAFVHPGSLGDDIRDACFMTYERSGAHSRMFARRTADWDFPGFWDAVERGDYEYAGYKIHHRHLGTALSRFSARSEGRTRTRAKRSSG
jgi:phenylpropionate dioxygenase-like ring-hydroxylating dioxygenase large terminal subunit